MGGIIISCNIIPGIPVISPAVMGYSGDIPSKPNIGSKNAPTIP